MKKANDLNINTRNYWNSVYGDTTKRAAYKAQGTDDHSIKLNTNSVCVSITKRFDKALEYININEKVMDIGCGVGVFTNLVKKTYPSCEVWGIDISDKAIEANKLESPDINYSQGYIGSLALKKDYFDVIFCGETIEHLEDPKTLFTEAYRALKQGGKLIITTPKDEHIKSDEHLWYFNQGDVEDLFLNNGFKRIEFAKLPDMEHLFVLFAVGYKE